MKHLDLDRQIYEHLGLGAVQACSHREIEELESQYRCTLPEAYKEYLGWMGRGTTDLLRGSRCFIPT